MGMLKELVLQAHDQVIRTVNEGKFVGGVNALLAEINQGRRVKYFPNRVSSFGSNALDLKKLAANDKD